MNKELIVFDLDGTLTESKSRVTEKMAIAFAELLVKYQVAVISGCAFKQFKEQFVLPMISYNDPFPRLSNLYLLPTCGSQLYEYAGREAGFSRMYHNDLILCEKVEVYNAWATSVNPTGGWDESDIIPDKQFGEIAEDRGSQITFSMCGQEAPLDVKKAYDPDCVKRQKVISTMKARLLDKYEIRIGGTTSIDVTRAGIDKAYGINKLLDWIHLKKEDVFFIGDALFPGGNDRAVKDMGVKCKEVTGPEETIKVINAINSDLEMEF